MDKKTNIIIIHYIIMNKGKIMKYSELRLLLVVLLLHCLQIISQLFITKNGLSFFPPLVEYVPAASYNLIG